MNLKSYLSNIRFYVLILSFVVSLVEFIWVKIAIPDLSLQIIRLTQIYALTAISYLYLALLAGPFCYTFKTFPFRAKYIKARRALGVSTFYFATLHGSLAFFGQLGGFGGLGFLDNKYLLAISLSSIALIILFFMAITSMDFMVEKLGFKNWKMLHRLVYLAGLLILIHALMLGTHFANLSDLIPKIFFVCLAFLLILETIRIYAFLKKKYLGNSKTR